MTPGDFAVGRFSTTYGPYLMKDGIPDPFVDLRPVPFRFITTGKGGGVRSRTT